MHSRLKFISLSVILIKVYRNMSADMIIKEYLTISMKTSLQCVEETIEIEYNQVLLGYL